MDILPFFYHFTNTFSIISLLAFTVLTIIGYSSKTLESGQSSSLVWKECLPFIFYVYLSNYLPKAIAPELSSFVIFDLWELSTLQGTLVGLLIYEGGNYFWHRCLHSSPFLWRTFHHLKHGENSQFNFTDLFLDQLNNIGLIYIGTLSFALLFGLGHESITQILISIQILSLFKRLMIKTPFWIGFIVTRPESNALHYTHVTRGCNYSNLPIFDILFGTFKNPRQVVEDKKDSRTKSALSVSLPYAFRSK